MSDKYELTRRKTLLGLGTVGLAGAGAGVGTGALFSDEESFNNNSITAGTLDMSVTATIEGANEYWEERVEQGQDDDLAIDGLSRTADGDVVAGLSVTDVKPGDWAIICFEFDVEGNPAYVQIRAENLVSSENGIEEPEPDNGEAGGELEDEMLALVYRKFKGVQPSNSANPPYSYLRNGSRITPGDSRVRDTYGLFNTGYTLSDGSGQPVEVASGNDAVRRHLLLHLPENVGNVVQGDSFSLDLVFRAVQVRNNPVGGIDIQDQTAGSSIDPPGTYARAELAGVKYVGPTNTLASEPQPIKDNANLVAASNPNVPTANENGRYFIVGLHAPGVGSGEPDKRNSLIGIAALPTGSYDGITAPVLPTTFTGSGFPPSGETEVTTTLWHGPGGSETGPIRDSNGSLYLDSATVTFP